MKKSLLIASFALLSLPASAQSLLDEGSSMLQQKAGNSATSSVAGMGAGLPSNSLSIDALKQKITQAGYSKISGIMPSITTKGALQASALNSAGTPTNLQVNPTTGDIISAIAAR